MFENHPLQSNEKVYYDHQGVSTADSFDSPSQYVPIGHCPNLVL